MKFIILFSLQFVLWILLINPSLSEHWKVIYLCSALKVVKYYCFILLLIPTEREFCLGHEVGIYFFSIWMTKLIQSYQLNNTVFFHWSIKLSLLSLKFLCMRIWFWALFAIFSPLYAFTKTSFNFHNFVITLTL